jgi:hypothetical protein
MLGHPDRDAERTERYVDELIDTDRAADDVPMDADVDPLVHGSARRLRADLIRVHPSFRFEEALAERLAAAAVRIEAGLPAEIDETTPLGGKTEPVGATVTVFPLAIGSASRDTGLPRNARRAILPAAAFRRLPEVTSRSSRPFIVGGVGVASAAISLGAVYVAWRHSRPGNGRMSRAIKAAHGRSAGSSRVRRSGTTHGIFGVLS